MSETFSQIDMNYFDIQQSTISVWKWHITHVIYIKYLNTDLLNLKRESVTCVFRLCTYVGLWSSNKVYL